MEGISTGGCPWGTLSFERLEPRLAMAGVVINEFLAINVDGIVDQDGDAQRLDRAEEHRRRAGRS